MDPRNILNFFLVSFYLKFLKLIDREVKTPIFLNYLESLKNDYIFYDVYCYLLLVMFTEDMNAIKKDSCPIFQVVYSYEYKKNRVFDMSSLVPIRMEEDSIYCFWVASSEPIDKGLKDVRLPVNFILENFKDNDSMLTFLKLMFSQHKESLIFINELRVESYAVVIINKYE